ncbi:TonB-dependent receptor [Thauera butanivorans]|uniref:TonB-dependent receptor n=1 Tax=Thauera butanivorans TaxID=86174 RepID=UPI003AB5A428
MTKTSHPPAVPALRSTHPRFPGRRRLLSGLVARTLVGGMLSATAFAAAAQQGPISPAAELDAEIGQLEQALEEARKRRAGLAPAAGTDGAGSTSPAAGAADAADDDVVSIDAVVVRARNREERLQDVPIPVSVVSGRELERDHAVNISDFARRATNVQAAELNSRRSSVSIRGVGKNVNGEEYEAPVGVIIDNVFQPYVGASWTNFPDLESIEIARGPQGTLLGKNTTLGVLNISTRKPSFTPQYSAEATVGSRDLKRITGTLSGPLVENALAYRFSFFNETGEGSIDGQGQNKSTWYDRNRSGARLQFLALPADDVSARVILHHARARENINMSPNVSDPAAFLDGAPRGITFTSRITRGWFGGYQPLFEKFKVDADYVTPSIDEQNGASVEINWNLAGHTLTSITAYKDNRFVADNDFDKTRWDIRRGGGARTAQRQFSEEIRLTSRQGGSFDYQTGLYALYNGFNNETHTVFGRDAGAFYASNPQYATLSQNAAGRELLAASLDGTYTAQKRSPETTSFAAFGQFNWRFTEQATLTAGLRQTWERKKNTWSYLLYGPGADLDALGAANGASAAQIAAAKAIRGGPTGTGAGQIGSLARFGPKRHADNSDTATSVLLSPSYKLDDDTLLYASVARGVKSGAVGWNTADGTPNVTDPEVAIDFELGTKLSLLERRLILNVNLFNTDIKDFQTDQVVPDAGTATGVRNIIGNARKVRLRGVEFDGAFAVSQAFTLRFGGAVNHARYKDYKDAPCPSDLAASLPLQCDFSGRQLPGAPKYTLNLGAEYRQPVGQGLILSAHVNNSYSSKQNVALNLSEHGWESSRNITDAGIGFGPASGAWQISLFAKNLFDVEYAVDTSTFTGNSAVSKRWGERRSVGLSFRASL